MLSVEESLPDGRRRSLTARAVPADVASGPVRFAVGMTSGRTPRPMIPAPRPPADDLLALAVAVGVIA